MLHHEAYRGLLGVRRERLFSLSTISVFAVCFAAGTGIFSIIYSVVLRPLPYSDPDQLAVVLSKRKSEAAYAPAVPWAYFRVLREQHGTFQECAAYRVYDEVLHTEAGVERIQEADVSPALLSILGVHPFVGRTLAPSDDIPGASPVAMLSYSFWRRRYGGNPAVIGTHVPLGEVVQSTKVVGVLPPDFRFFETRRSSGPL